MNWRYGIHPNNYAIGETEKYYSDMSEKGWELVKCCLLYTSDAADE